MSLFRIAVRTISTLFSLILLSFVFVPDILSQDTQQISRQSHQDPGKYASRPSSDRLSTGTGEPVNIAEQRFRPTPASVKESDFEKYVSGNVPGPGSSGLRQFGYDLFDNPPSTFAPVQNVPVGPDYVIGPGDTVKIEVWGKIEGSWTVTVDSNGNMGLPKIGVFGVTGLTFRELKDVLQKEFSRYYTGFEMNVSMGSLRTIRVYVMGNARRPGVYTVSSFSTMVNALFEGGGPSKTGSMRNIQLKRSGRTIADFDLYKFLLLGDKTGDVRLMPEDVIFIPPVGPLAAVAGNVKTPAIYELKEETRLFDLIGMAGGLTGIAFKGRVQVQRVEDHRFKTVFETDLLSPEQSGEKNILMQDGDVANIFSVTDSLKTVTLRGAVAYPGTYGITPGTTIKDVISLAGGLMYFASEKAELTRVNMTSAGPQTDITGIDLAKALEGDNGSNVELAMNDYLFVRTLPEWNLYRTVSIAGEVKFPGTYTIKKGETLSSLIERAGGFTDKAYLPGAIFTRERVREQQQTQLNEIAGRLERDLLGSGVVQVATASTTEEARIFEMELEQKRLFVEQLRISKAKGRVPLRLSDPATFRGSAYDIELEQGDSLLVPVDPKTVLVIGSVFNQSAFVYESGKRHPYYLELAGGYASNADDDNIYILRANGVAVKAGKGFLGRGEPVNPGDTIVVPERVERIPWMRNTKDITQILYQIAVAAGVLILAF